MHDVAGFLEDLAVVLCVAALTTVVFQRLRQPVVLGYLLAGLLIGPHVPFIGVSDLETVHTFSELGVVLLMFSLGLEFSVRKILRMGPAAGVIGAVEVGWMCWLGFLAGRLFGWGVQESVFLGAMLSISSTMIVAKSFAEERMDRRVSDLAFSILVIEDLAAILMMAILGTFAAGSGWDAGAAFVSAGRLFLFLIILVTVGLFLIPRFLAMVVRSTRPETCVVATVGTCFAGALLAHEFGFSAGLGAFLAGSLCAESGHARTLEHQIRPLRDIFAAIFFVSVGMLIDPLVILEHWGAIVTLALVVIVGKTLGVTVGSLLAGHSTQQSVQAGMSLTQIGEFSFMIAGIGLTLGPRSSFLYPIAVAVCVLTTFTTPFLIRYSGRVAARFDRALPRGFQTFLNYYGMWLKGLREREATDSAGARLRRSAFLLVADLTMIVGLIIGISIALPKIETWTFERFNLSGLIVSAGLVLSGGLLAIPFVLGSFRSIRRLGLLLAAEALPGAQARSLASGRASRRAFVLAVQMAIFLSVALPILAVVQPFVPPFPGVFLLGTVLVFTGFLFWRRANDLEGEVQAGTEMVADILGRQSRNVMPLALGQIQELLPGLGDLHPVKIEPESAAVGESLIGLNLRGRTGATVISIVRDTDRVLAPSGQESIQPGDVLILSGSAEALRAAKSALSRRAPTQETPETPGSSEERAAHAAISAADADLAAEEDAVEDARKALSKIPSLIRGLRRDPEGDSESSRPRGEDLSSRADSSS